MCSVAATGGHLEVLQWARANGCPWDDNYMQQMLLKEVIWRFCNGQGQMAVLGMKGHACSAAGRRSFGGACNGQGQMAVLGMNGHASSCCRWRSFGGSAVGKGKWLSLG